MILAARLALEDTGALLEITLLDSRGAPGDVQQTPLSAGRGEQLVRILLDYLDKPLPTLTPPRRRLYRLSEGVTSCS